MAKLFTTVKHGYSPEEVDSYIQTLEDVINEYKEKDNAIRNAIVNAQIAADNIVKNAEIEAEQMRQRAKAQAKEMSEAVAKHENVIKSFQDSYNALVSKYLVAVNETEFNELYEKLETIKNSFNVN